MREWSLRETEPYLKIIVTNFFIHWEDKNAGKFLGNRRDANEENKKFKKKKIARV